ncbi:uncharacterized protein LOC131023040 [Salvia miltiorrhiza]|nr:uncharacterized protein LOC131023040 [Salvia miltiorrhiza]
MSDNRSWMYARYNDRAAFETGLESFLEFAINQTAYTDGIGNIRCPCRKCKNKVFASVPTVREHVTRRGFVHNYTNWCYQGEAPVYMPAEHTIMDEDDGSYSNYQRMVHDHAGPSNYQDPPNLEEPPNPDAQQIYDMLNAADSPLYPDCDTYSQLSWMTQMMSIKVENHMSERCFNQISEMVQKALPKDNNCPDSFYSTKRNLRGLGLPVEKIDCCVNNCMLYWGDDSELESCNFCGASRYKENLRASGSRRKKRVAAKQMHYFPLTPRLQRLFASAATAENMRWHATSIEDGIMRHPADSPAWKHLNSVYPGFTEEIRNVRLGLSTDGFAPFAQSGRQYSSWPVIVTPYNLPPWLCMKEQFMFLTVLVPGPSNPKMKLDVFLQPLIHELKYL